MKIITVADERMKAIASLTLKLNDQAGYQTEQWPIPPQFDGYTFGTWPERIRGKCPYKALIVQNALQNYSKPIVWMDADAFCVSRIESVFEKLFDIAVTVKRPDELTTTPYPAQYGHINAGVMFFRPNHRTARFLKTWQKRTGAIESHSDQEALTRMLLEVSGELKRGDTIVDANGTKILLLSTDEYNWYYWPEPVPATAKILHMKTDKREVGLAYAMQRVCEPA